jgi:rubredoxin
MKKETNVLMLRCSKCEFEFRSPIGGPISKLESAALINITLVCPNCKKPFITSKPDYFYYDDAGDEKLISFSGKGPS